MQKIIMLFFLANLTVWAGLSQSSLDIYISIQYLCLNFRNSFLICCHLIHSVLTETVLDFSGKCLNIDHFRKVVFIAKDGWTLNAIIGKKLHFQGIFGPIAASFIVLLCTAKWVCNLQINIAFGLGEKSVTLQRIEKMPIFFSSTCATLWERGEFREFHGGPLLSRRPQSRYGHSC